MRVRGLMIGGVLAALWAWACNDASAPSCTSNCVTIQDFSFTPETLTVTAGARVTWTNAGPSTHTVTSDGGTFNSGALAAPNGGNGYGGATAGGVFQFTFSTPGTYPYHCSIHPPASYPAFIGTVVVTP